ncbi:hypothetical protein JCM9279_002363 [Rhodotorula babjevae]
MSAPAPSAPATPSQVRSEDILSAKTDLCLSNALVKAGTGLAVGIVASAILFRRRPWPVFLGLGFGAGQGYADCERVFNPAAVPGYRVQGAEGQASPFKLSTQLASVVSPSQASGVKPAPAAKDAAKDAAASAKREAASLRDGAADAASSAKESVQDAAGAAQSAAQTVAHKVGDAVREAKHRAGAVAAQVEHKADEVKDAVVGKAREVEGEVKQEQDKARVVDDGRKWV